MKKVTKHNIEYYLNGGEPTLLDRGSPPDCEAELAKNMREYYRDHVNTFAVTFNITDKMKVGRRIFWKMTPKQHYDYYREILPIMLKNQRYIFVIDYNKRNRPHLHGIISFDHSRIEAMRTGLQQLATWYFKSIINDINPVNNINSWIDYCTAKKSFPPIYDTNFKFSV